MRILIAGLGGIGQRHVRNLRAAYGSQIELIAYRVRRLSHVVTPTLDIDSTRDVERQYGIEAFASLAEALARKPDIAFVTNPTSMHIETAIECASAGCDLFLEKPLSHDEARVSELSDLIAQKSLVAMVGFQLRFHPAFVKFAEIVKSGALGEILAVRATIGEYLANWHRYEDYRTMYAARADLGGGVVLSQIHELDYLYSLFGMPSRVFALGGRFSHLEIDVEDTADALLEFRFGERALPITLHQDYLQRPPSRNCEVIGDRGVARLDLVSASVTANVPSGASEEMRFGDFDRNALFTAELDHFMTCVRDRATPSISLRDGLASLRIALAIKASIASGKVVDLPVPWSLHA